MYDQIDKRRAKRIYAILVKFASGNLNARINRTNVYDDVEVLISIINTTLEKVSTFFYHQGFANHNETYNYRIQLFFLLDSDDRIITLSHNVKKLLCFDNNHLKEKPFYDVLTDQSKLDWNRLKSQWLEAPNKLIILSFKTRQGSILKMNCLVDKTQPSEHIIVTAVEIEKRSEKIKRELYNKVLNGCNNSTNDAVLALPKKYQTRLSRTDIEKVKKAHEYLKKQFEKNNIGESLPAIKELATKFGLKENRLNAGFRQIYGQSANDLFYSKHSAIKMAKRLKIAMPLVTQTTIPLSRIAAGSGFTELSNFSFAFKREYGKSPMEIRQEIRAIKNGEEQ